MRNALDKSCREYQNTHFVISNCFRKSCRLWENVKNIVEWSRPQRTIWRMRIACWIRLQIHTVKLCNIHCFYTASMVARTRLIVTLYVHCLSCLIYRVKCFCMMGYKRSKNLRCPRVVQHIIRKQTDKNQNSVMLLRVCLYKTTFSWIDSPSRPWRLHR
jgi:hypothetical protein